MSREFNFEFGLPELSRALVQAGHELYGFGMALWALDERVRKEIADTLLQALEHNYFTYEIGAKNELSHKEYREELYALLYRRACESLGEGSLPGVSDMRFYALPLAQRAALYLRSRTSLSWEALGRIMSIDERAVNDLVTEARECLLGHKPFSLDEEIF